jgi:short-subunit dehydrogenase
VLTGIGKSIAFKLARQGLNVVLVALGDDLLDSSVQEIQTAFPTLQFRKARVAVTADASGCCTLGV